MCSGGRVLHRWVWESSYRYASGNNARLHNDQPTQLLMAQGRQARASAQFNNSSTTDPIVDVRFPRVSVNLPRLRKRAGELFTGNLPTLLLSEGLRNKQSSVLTLAWGPLWFS